MQLAEQFGFISVSEMLRNVSSLQITQWIAYFNLKNKRENEAIEKAKKKAK